MLLKVTPEMWLTARKEYDKTYNLSRTCPITQAMKAVFKYCLVTTGIETTCFHTEVLGPFKDHYHGDQSFHIGLEGQSLIRKFDHTEENLEEPVEIEIYWWASWDYSPEQFEEALMEDMQD